MGVCEGVTDLYAMVAWLLLVVLCGQFLAIVSLIVRHARVAAQWELYRASSELQSGPGS